MKEMLYNDLIISTVLINSIFIPEAQPESVFLGTDSGIFFSTDKGVHFKYFMDGISATKIYSFEEINGETFAGTDNGIYMLENKLWRFVGLENEKVYSLKRFKKGLFAGTDNAIFRVGSDNLVKVLETGFPVQQMSCFKEDLLAATPYGLINAESGDKLMDMPALSSASSDTCLFVGTHYGVRKTYDGKEFYVTKLTDGIIRAVAISKEGILFAGTDSGLYISKNEGKSFEKRLQNAHIFSLITHPLYSQTVFVGTWGRGLIHYKFANSP